MELELEMEMEMDVMKMFRFRFSKGNEDDTHQNNPGLHLVCLSIIDA